jgi:hypothetical protein
VSVPYSFDATPWANIPAVATDRFVFWITNPSLAMYFAMNQQCRQLSAGATAFQAESSYSSIQVWRIDPYEFCPIDPMTNERRCPEDASATFRTLPGFISGSGSLGVCTQYFLVVAPALTYVNEYNLALTVLNTTFMNVDTQTLRPINASLARSVAPHDELPRLKVHAHPGGGQHLPLLALHVVVLDDHAVQLVEKVHAVFPAPGVGAQHACALEKLVLVARVRARDCKHLVQLGLVGQLRHHGAQSVHVARQMANDQIDLICRQNPCELQLDSQRPSRECLHFF